MTERERRRSAPAGLPSPLTANFSAKEAVYKAVNPIVGQMVRFQEVEISWQDGQELSSDGKAAPARNVWTAKYIGPNIENCIIDGGIGTLFELAEHIGALFWLPVDGSP